MKAAENKNLEEELLVKTKEIDELQLQVKEIEDLRIKVNQIEVHEGQAQDLKI